MAPIVAPAPRLPLQHTLVPPATPIRLPPRPCASPPRLLSPIRLHDPPHVPINPKSPTPCAPAHKRRAPSRLAARATRRRRHPQRIDSPFDAFGRPFLFDQLPWISTLEIPRTTACDLADLPLHEDPLSFSDATPASGPMRRRKTSLRSNPLATSAHQPPTEPPFRKQPPAPRPTDPYPQCPKTPPPRVRFDPSTVTFHNLMPVFPRGVHLSSPF